MKGEREINCPWSLFAGRFPGASSTRERRPSAEVRREDKRRQEADEKADEKAEAMRQRQEDW